VAGKDLPANSEVRVGVVDVKTGQETTGQLTVATDANGAFVKKIPMDLGEHPPLLLDLGLVLLAAGGLLVRGSHRAYHPAP
jgi:hypothetical protein